MSSDDPFDFGRFQPRRTPAAPPDDRSSARTGEHATSGFEATDRGRFDLLDPGIADTGFGEAPAATLASDAVGGPPVSWLIAAAVTAGIGLVLGALPVNSVAAYGFGWLLGGPAAIGLLAVFNLRRTDYQARFVYYGEPAWVGWLARSAIALSALAIVLDAFRIADWAARR